MGYNIKQLSKAEASKLIPTDSGTLIYQRIEDGLLYWIDENGNHIIIGGVPGSVTSVITQLGNGLYQHDDGLGNLVNIDASTTTLTVVDTNNIAGGGTISVQAMFDAVTLSGGHTSVFTDNGDGTFDHDDGDGTVVTFDAADALAAVWDNTAPNPTHLAPLNVVGRKIILPLPIDSEIIDAGGYFPAFTSIEQAIQILAAADGVFMYTNNTASNIPQNINTAAYRNSNFGIGDYSSSSVLHKFQVDGSIQMHYDMSVTNRVRLDMDTGFLLGGIVTGEGMGFSYYEGTADQVAYIVTSDQGGTKATLELMSLDNGTSAEMQVLLDVDTSTAYIGSVDGGQDATLTLQNGIATLKGSSGGGTEFIVSNWLYSFDDPAASLQINCLLPTDNTNTKILAVDPVSRLVEQVDISTIVSQSSFDITDTTTTQTVNGGDTITFAGGPIMTATVSNPDTVTISIDTSGASTGDVLTFSGIEPQWTALPAAENIYTTDGNLSGNRIVSSPAPYLLGLAFNVLNYHTILSSSITHTAVNSQSLNANTLTLSGVISVEVKTPLVNTASATVGHVLTLVNSLTGESEFQALGNYTFDIVGSSGVTATVNDGETVTITPPTFMDVGVDVSNNIDITWDNTQFNTGDILYFNGSNLVTLPIGSSGQLLEVDGASEPQWTTLVTGMSSFYVTDLGTLIEVEDGDVITFGASNLLNVNVGVGPYINYNIDTTGASAGEVITFNGAAVVWGTSAAGTNFATADLTLTGNRIHDFLGVYAMTLDDILAFTIQGGDITQSLTTSTATLVKNAGAGDVASFALFEESTFSTARVYSDTLVYLDSPSIELRHTGGTAAELLFNQDDLLEQIGIKAPASGVTSYGLTLPAVQGGASTTFSNNGSGTLSWVTLVTAIDDLSDVNITSAAVNDILRYDGSDWINVDPYLRAEDVNSNTSITLTLANYYTNRRDLRCTAATAVNVDIPVHATEAFPVGFAMDITSYGAGTVTVSPDTGVTLNGLVAAAGDIDIDGQYNMVHIWKIATDEWLAVGGIA